MIFDARLKGLCAKIISWVAMTSFAIPGEEMTMVVTSPSWRCTRGPYFLARSWSLWCGRDPSKLCRFPMMGSFHGPGGKSVVTRALVLGFFHVLNTMKIKKRNGTSVGKEKKCENTICANWQEWIFVQIYSGDWTIPYVRSLIFS